MLGAVSLVVSVVVVLIVLVMARRVFDIRQAIIRIFSYALVLLTLALIYFILAYIVSGTLLRNQLSESWESIATNVVLALILAFLFQPIKTFFNKVTNQLFYQDYLVDEFISYINKALTSTNDLRTMLEKTAITIASTLKAEQVSFFTYLDAPHYLTAGTAKYSRLPRQDAEEIQREMNPKVAVILASELPPTSRLRRLMISHRLAVVMPLRTNDGLVGYLCVGENRASGYRHRDISALITVADELVIAIQNALSVHEVRELNETLQQRVNEATRELRTSNAQLQRLDEAKDEFISMASHQLRTPLTSVKGYISMIVDGDVGKITAQQKQLLEEAYLSSERMVRLIGDFLNVSRLQTGKFTIEKRPTDLVQVTTQEIAALQPGAKLRGLTLSFTPPKKFPLLNIDESKMRQVVMNFSDNAIYYSKAKSVIKISLKVEGPDVVFTVKDTGIGVPASQQASLFNKFFRATNARLQRPDGTGVGLFLTKKVIDAHRGTIIFESKEGKGSTFGFRLPLAVAKVDPTMSPSEQSQSPPAPQ